MRIFNFTFIWEEIVEGKSCAEGRSSNKQVGAENYVMRGN